MCAVNETGYRCCEVQQRDACQCRQKCDCSHADRDDHQKHWPAGHKDIQTVCLSQICMKEEREAWSAKTMHQIVATTPQTYYYFYPQLYIKLITHCTIRSRKWGCDVYQAGASMVCLSSMGNIAPGGAPAMEAILWQAPEQETAQAIEDREKG